MIKVGINGPLVITGASITDKGWLEMHWKELLPPDKEKVDAFDALNSADYVETGDGTNKTTIFPPLAPHEKTKTGELIALADRVAQAQDNLGELKNTLQQIMLCYVTTDKIKWDAYKGLGLTRENLPDLIVTEETLKAISRNMFDTFLEVVTPFFNDESISVRLLMVRQSKTKHFPSFRNKFVKDNPIIELAVIPAADSKLKFTGYEIKEGLDKDTPVATSTDAPAAGEVAEDMEAKNIFNQQQ